jgi:A/G-specific adenine glycosylase
VKAKPDQLAAITSKLLRWFSKNGRRFPWRETFERPDPYIVLFTEIMLQRTKAEQVIPVYLEFVRRYPTFEILAKAPRRDVEHLFSRLGLVWRAKKVTELVEFLQGHFHGRIPDDPLMLRELPGVGDYVAKAVLCYAFGKNEAPIDTNVVRVISRLFGKRLNPDLGRRNKTILSLTQSLVPKGKDARSFNLALLDLGALICRTRPRCDECPLNLECEYYRQSSPLTGAE